jgi:hypothetical protein
MSRAGTIRLKQVAASMTPAEKPSSTSNSLSEIRLANNVGNAPTPVANPAAKQAMKPTQKTSIPKSAPSTKQLIDSNSHAATKNSGVH